MATKQKTILVTGASQGIGAGVVQTFLDRGYNVVANSRNISKSEALKASDQLALVDGNIGESAVAAKIVETAVTKFGSIDGLVNNAASSLQKLSRTTLPKISRRCLQSTLKAFFMSRRAR